MSFASTETIRKGLTDLLARSVTARVIPPAPFDTKNTHAAAVYAVYICEDDSVWSVILCDLGLAGHLGAALTRIPPDVARSCVTAKRLSPEIFENLREVLNVSTRLLNQTDAPTIHVSGIYLTPGDVPSEASALIAKPGDRMDLQIQIDGYAGGRLSIRTR